MGLVGPSGGGKSTCVQLLLRWTGEEGDVVDADPESRITFRASCCLLATGDDEDWGTVPRLSNVRCDKITSYGLLIGESSVLMK